MTDKQRTFIDELGQSWPSLDGVHFRIICEVGDNPGQSMAEIALRLDMSMTTVFHKVTSMKNLTKKRKPISLLSVHCCEIDKRKKRVKLTKAGYEIAKILQPLNSPIEDTKIIKKDKEQLDFFLRNKK